MLKVTLLGTGGMMPLKNRALASAMLSCEGRNLLIDCGEGTQVQIRECGYSFKPIDALLLTHYHGDHVSGLPGLLLSMGNQGRELPLLIAGPPGLRRVVEALRVIAPGMPFSIELHEIDPAAPGTFSCAGLDVQPFALRHGMPCLGYALDLRRAGRFQPERARAAGVPLKLWSVLQKQPRVEFEGRVYTSDMVLTPPRRGIKVVYATDTRPVPAISAAARDCDLMICEGMYGDPDKLPRAREAGHMMMDEAAAIAASAGAQRLWFTHYSPAMPDPRLWLERARAIYPTAELGEDGMSIDLPFID